MGLPWRHRLKEAFSSAARETASFKLIGVLAAPPIIVGFVLPPADFHGSDSPDSSLQRGATIVELDHGPAVEKSVDFQRRILSIHSNSTYHYAARLNAVSEAVASAIASMSGPFSAVLAGNPIATFNPVSASDCSAAATGNCTGSGTYSAAAIQNLSSGRGIDTTCSDPVTVGVEQIGMCDFLVQMTTNKVNGRYEFGELSDADRPPELGLTGAPAPAMAISTRPLSSQYIMLSSLDPGLAAKSMFGLPTTVPSEDLNSSRS
jgi:hypothetical protein